MPCTGSSTGAAYPRGTTRRRVIVVRDVDEAQGAPDEAVRVTFEPLPDSRRSLDVRVCGDGLAPPKEVRAVIAAGLLEAAA